MKTLIFILMLSLSFCYFIYSQRIPTTSRDNTGDRIERTKGSNPTGNDLGNQQRSHSPEKTRIPESKKPADPVTTPNNPPPQSPHSPINHYPTPRPPDCPVQDPSMPIIIDNSTPIEQEAVPLSLSDLSLSEINELGINRLNNELYIQSIDCFDLLLQNDPLDFEVYCLRGRAYNGLEMYERAKKDYEVSIKIDSTYGECYYYLGITEMQLGNKPEARKNFELASLYEYKQAEAILKKYFKY